MSRGWQYQPGQAAAAGASSSSRRKQRQPAQAAAAAAWLLRVVKPLTRLSMSPPPPLAHSDVLHHSPVAGLLRPAYAIVLDRPTRSLILIIRGTHSRQDMFTSLIGESRFTSISPYAICLTCSRR